MNDYIYHNTTKIIFGRSAEKYIGSECKALADGGKVLLLLGGLSSMKDAYPFLPELGATDMFFTAFYPWAIWVITLVACITGWGRLFEGKNGEPVKTLNESVKK